MNDLTTIQRLNREATERAEAEARREREERDAQWRSHSLYLNAKLEAGEAERCSHCGDIIVTGKGDPDGIMADHVIEYHARKAAMQRHPAGSKRITEPAVDPARTERTPEEIADEVWEEGGVRQKESRDEVLAMVAEAVRRDRARRTPERIADEAADEIGAPSHAEWERIRGIVQHAIHADRAQRSN